MAHSEPCWGPEDVEICEDCCSDALVTMDPAQVEMLKSMAAWYLWRATGGRYGLCETTYRPCRKECGEYWGGLPYPLRIQGQWVNMECGACSGPCGCGQISEVILPDVHSITGIEIDGVSLDPLETAVVYDHRQIVRADGGVWPSCQDLSVASGDGAWSITVQQGTPIPPGGKIVAGILACELAKACVDDSGCRLPKRVQTVTRQGVTIGFADHFEGLEDLRVGLWEVDAFLEASRSTRWRQPSIWSPDVPRPSVLTWPLAGVSP